MTTARPHAHWAYQRLLTAGLSADALEPLLPLGEQEANARSDEGRLVAELARLDASATGEGRYGRAARLARTAEVRAGLERVRQQIAALERQTDAAVRGARGW